MNVVDVSNFDVVGGAGIAAFPLHQGLKRVGIESRMVVAQTRNEDERVELIQQALSI